eukprot:2978291-Alexandrium_andersonii.AAC.1
MPTAARDLAWADGSALVQDLHARHGHPRDQPVRTHAPLAPTAAVFAMNFRTGSESEAERGHKEPRRS